MEMNRKSLIYILEIVKKCLEMSRKTVIQSHDINATEKGVVISKIVCKQKMTFGT